MLARDKKIQQVLDCFQKFGKGKISTRDAASIMGCDSETFRRHIAKGNIKAVVIGRTYFTSKQWLRNMLSAKDFSI